MTKEERQAVEGEMVTLREYMESLLSNQKVYFDMKLASMGEAQKKYEEFQDARLEKMNEIREQLATQKSEFVTRSEFEGKHEILCVKVESLQKIVWGIAGALAILEFILRFIK